MMKLNEQLKEALMEVLYSSIMYGVCFFICLSFIEIDKQTLVMSLCMAFVFFLIYVIYHFHMISQTGSKNSLSLCKDVRIRVQKLLNNTLKYCLLNSILVNAVTFSYFLDFGIIQEEYRWIVTLFAYAWIMAGWGASLFDFLIVVLTEAGVFTGHDSE